MAACAVEVEVELNLHLVRCLVAVVEEGHFGRAAARLFVSPPALSQQVRKLERALGAPLVDRSAHPLRLTAAGEAFMAEAERALEAADRAVVAVAVQLRAEQSVLRVGFMTASAGPRLREMIAAVEGAVPGVTVELVGMPWSRQIEAVRDGSCDASLVRPPFSDTAGLQLDLVEWEPRVVALPRDHRLADRHVVSLDDLDDEVHVTDDRADPVWVRWWACDPRPSGAPVRYGPQAHTMDELLEVVANRQAIAITASSVVDTYRRPDIAYVPIADAEPCPLSLCTRDADVGPLVVHLRHAAAQIAIRHPGPTAAQWDTNPAREPLGRRSNRAGEP